jgi:tetratricopeptide (TPR) repeat protein
MELSVISDTPYPICERIETKICEENLVSTNRRRSLLNFVIISAVITTIGALLSPFAIAWWQNSNWKNSWRLPASQVSELRNQSLVAEKLLLAEPGNQTALKTLVKAKLQLADVQGSVSALEKLAALNPQTPEYTVLLGQSQQYLGDREAAATSYRRVLTGYPQNINALQGLVSLLVDGKKPEAAIGVVQEAINAPSPDGKPVDVTSLKLLLAQIYVSQQRYADALPIYDELTQTNDRDFRPILARGMVLKQLGNLSEAKTLLSQAVDLAPSKYKDQVQSIAQSATLPSIGMLPSPAASSTPSPSATSSPANSPSPSSSPSPSK